jgi:hypothetical protein
MLAVTKEYVKSVAESMNLAVSDDAAAAFAPDVEYRLREILQVSPRLSCGRADDGGRSQVPQACEEAEAPCARPSGGA